MLKKIVLSGIFYFLLVLTNLNAATLDVSIEGLDSLFPNGIVASQILFEIDGEWNFESSPNGGNTNTINWPLSTGLNGISPYSKLSMSIPGYGDLYDDKWSKGANQPKDELLVVALLDKEYVVNYLTDGLLFSLKYPDDVMLTLRLLDIEFINQDYELVNFFPSATVFGAGDNKLVFSQVPIPSTLLLLGGGILVLLGGSRRKNRKREMAHEN